MYCLFRSPNDSPVDVEEDIQEESFDEDDAADKEVEELNFNNNSNKEDGLDGVDREVEFNLNNNNNTRKNGRDQNTNNNNGDDDDYTGSPRKQYHQPQRSSRSPVRVSCK